MSGSITRELTRFFLYSRKGNKILLIITITIILICFMKLGEVAAVEEVQDVNFEVYNYYDSVINDAIVRLYKLYQRDPNNAIFGYLKNVQDFHFIFYYGNSDGSSYNGSIPLSDKNLYITLFNSYQSSNLVWTPTSNDYGGVSGYTMYEITYSNAQVFGRFNFNGNLMSGYSSFNKVYFPYRLFNYVSQNWEDFLTYFNNGDTQAIQQLLEDIKTEQQEINEYLQSDDTSEVDTSLPTESAEDPTDALWSDLFTSIRTAATSNTPQYISITIPFINYSFIFSPVESSPMTQLRAKMEPLYNLIIASWWFGASLWIIRDIHKYLEDIKNGDITSRDNNIKTEVL